MARILVTGAAGFLGFHLTRRLAKLGHSVVAVDIGRHTTADQNLAVLRGIPNVEIIMADLCDPTQVATLPEVDGVYHLAALNGTQKFYSIPWRVLRDSTLPTIHLLDRYSKSPIDYFFYAGSSEAYAGTITTFGWEVPTAEDVPLTIDNPLNPRWSYGGSKLHGEIACIAAAVELDVPIAIGRFHNAYGPNMGNHHVIPDFIQRAQNGKFQLFGYENTRSFIFVDDAVKSVIAVAENTQGEITNIGGPDEFTMLEIGEMLMELGGWEGEIERHPAPEGSVLRRAPDISKLRSLVNVNEFVHIRDGLQLTLDDYLVAK